MKLLLLTTVAVLASSVFASQRSYQDDFDDVDSQFSALTNSLSALQAVADKLKHPTVSKKCKEAKSHIGVATSAWSSLTIGFYFAPWNARLSNHASVVKARLSSCNDALLWISQQTVVINNAKQYKTPLSNCRKTHSQCQSGCNSIFNRSPPASTPPNPRPSQGYSSGSYNPLQETACPISSSSEGFECLDTKSEISSCGGCVSMNEGENCLTIPGAAGVGCEDGRCVVFSVQQGFIQNSEGRPVLA